MLADDQHRENQRDGLGHDGKINVADPSFEQGHTDDKRQQHRHRDHRKQGKGEAVKGHPQPRQLGDLVPVHEVRNAGRGLDFGAGRVRGFELEEHRHAIAADPKKHALAQAEDAAVAPTQHQADRDKGVGQVFADHVQAEGVQREWKHHQDQYRQQQNTHQVLFATQELI